MKIGEYLGKIREFFLNVVEGVRNHYPPCCILNFSIDALRNLPSGRRRGQITVSSNKTYVPCVLHMRVQKQLSREELSSTEELGLGDVLLASDDVVETYINGNLSFRGRIPKGMYGVLNHRIDLLDNKRQKLQSRKK